VISNKLKDQLNYLKRLCDDVSKQLNLSEVDSNNKQQAKDIAAEISKQPNWMKGYLFTVMRKSSDSKILLKLLKPKGNEYVNERDYK